MKKNLLCLFLLITFISPFNCALAKEKAPKIDTFNYVNLPFWKNFNDDNLINDLVIVYKNNNDLKSTAYKVKEAQRIVKISLANELPHIGFDGYAGRTFASSDELYGNVVIPNYSESHFLFPLTMNYEIDIWGENHLKTKSQAKQLEMVEQDEKSVYISLTSAFATDYFSLVEVDKIINLQKQLINTQEKVVNAVQKKYKEGTANINDVILAQKALTYLKEELNSLDEKQDVLQNQLNVFLADRRFSELKRISYDNISFKPYIPEEIPISSLDKRPDWVKSEIYLQKLGLDVKIAKKDILPKFNLVGTLGFNFYDLSSSNTLLSALGVAPSMDIFSGGRKVNILKFQKYKYSQALEDYNKVILTSMQETNDALYALKNNNKKHLIAQDRLNLDKKELYLLDKKCKIGMADNLDLLLKQEQVILTEKQEIALNGNNIIATINLYKATGGTDFINPTL